MSVKRIISCTASMALLCVQLSAAGLSANIVKRVDTSDQIDQTLDLYRGSVVDLEVQLSCYQRPMDLSTATAVVFHALTNHQDFGTSYQVTGALGRVSDPLAGGMGWAYVRLDVDRVLPTNSPMTWVLAITDPTSSLVHAQGALRQHGTSVIAAHPQPVAVSWYEPYGSVQTEAGARLALGLEIFTALQVSQTNLEAAIALAALAGSNYVKAVAGAAVTPAGATNIAAGLISAIPHGLSSDDVGAIMATGAVAMLESPYRQSRTEQREDGTWTVTFAKSTDIMITGVSGEGYNGPQVGTVFRNPWWDDRWERTEWTGDDGSTLYALTEADLTKQQNWELFAANGAGWVYWASAYATLPATLLPEENQIGAVGSLSLDWVTITNDSKLATTRDLNEVQTNATDPLARSQISDLSNYAHGLSWIPAVDLGRSNAPMHQYWSNYVLYAEDAP